jgi:hypothetical protein
VTLIHEIRSRDAERDRRERWELHARLMLEAGYDPVWGLLKPPSTGPDPRDFPERFLVPARSGRGARSRPRDRVLGKRAA